MIEVQRTSQMEDAAISMAARYPRFIIRYKATLEKPIRLRQVRLGGLNMYHGRSTPEFDGQIEEWKQRGGVLLYMRAASLSEDLGEHDAALFIECPLSLSSLEAQCAKTKHIAVVYRPPTWRLHEECVFDHAPTAAKCKRFFAILKDADEQNAVCEAVGLTPNGQVVSDEVIRDVMDLSNRQFQLLRGATLRSAFYKSVMQLAPKIEPEDPYLLPTYTFITMLPKVGRFRLLLGNGLNKVSRFWKRDLKSLVRSGCVERKETLGLYFLDGIEPDWKRIDAEHQAAKAKLTQIVQLVDSAKEWK